MHFVATLAAVGSVASLASARVGFQFPDTVPLAKRQVTGAAYECHANCGYTIQDAAQDGYCDTDKWKTEFAACMDCANTYNIWRYYGTKVTDAAQKCGLTANPKPSGAASGGSSASASAPAATTGTPSAPASSAPAATSSAPAASSSAPAASSSAQPSAPGQSSQPTTAAQTSAATGSSSKVQSTAVATTGRPTASAAPTSGNNTTSTRVQVGAANLQQPAMLAAGAVALFAVNLI
ncbi:hypothetical protein ISF_02025 [Cordyceps fumosorosea ARSEF 2679]|uniref:Uncharacterized protein n=1 Tax=Cordyceps fumosorosea (strain ARSEF 2679) TaxID=1081104 RepID=A0A162LJL7_CORFA|nr:hypothetical protein ISF_02025 [Cordyceps fumosorosea ARSEF 2679]OAA71474.1 hypothetical protein ISF_02025 [Cordyceps fumosorosea ARSEF 2679]